MAVVRDSTGKLRQCGPELEDVAVYLEKAICASGSPHRRQPSERASRFQARGALKKELLEHLRRTRGMRRSRHHTQKTAVHGQIADAVSISERPAAVEDRAVPGH